MKYQALYRKYRPKTFEDVAGQAHIIRTIKNAIAADKISHAYLFSGPRGTGKTTTAKLLAKAANCSEFDGVDACGVCESCRIIQENRTADIIEIDAASNNGVDEIRDLRDKVKYAPSSAKYKVYIIDEVHMLTTGAFNALLKTLEEPPGHVIFVLATTEPHKIPLTIISRCQRFDFKKLSRESIVGRLSQICSHEGIEVEDNVLRLIAKISDGGMRDAIGILDQCVSFSDEKVKLDDVYELTGVVSIGMLEDIVLSTIEDSKVNTLKLIGDFNELGKDVVRLAEDIVLYLRDMVLIKHLPSLDEVSGNIYVSDKLDQISELVSEEVIYQAIDKLSKAITDMRYSSNPKIILEMTMLSLIDFDKPVILQPKVEVVPQTPEVQTQTELGQQMVVKADKTKEVPIYSELIEAEEVENASIEHNSESKEVTDDVDEVNEVDASQIRELIKRSEELRQQIKEVRINNVLALAHKPELEFFREKWASITSFSTDPIFGPVANLIGSSQLVVASSEGILVTFPHEPMADRVMDKVELIEKLLGIVFAREVYVVAVTDREWISIKDEYIHKSRRGHKYTVMPLPSMEEVHKIDHEIKTSKVREEPIIQKALDLDFVDEEIITIED